MASLPQPVICAVRQECLAFYAIEHCAEMALLADTHGRLVYANPAAGTLLGYGPEELLGHQLDEILPELQQVFPKGEGRKDTVCQHRNGKLLEVEVVLGQITVGERSTFQYAFLREIDERKRLEEQLREARKMEAVGLLVEGVSHDFNNLLTAILLYTGLLLDKLPPDSPLRPQAEQANVAAERGRSLVSQLTALGGRRAFEPTLLSLNEVVESVRDMLARLLGEHVHLQIHYGERLDAVWADRTQMEQMLVNLAVNARDAMPEYGVLRISTAQFTAQEDVARPCPEMGPGRYVQLTVSDTGCGMDEETRSHALKPFFTTKPFGQGTGLGLSTVNDIVRRSHGYLVLESAPERGTQVQVFLPGVAGDPARASAPRQELQALGAGTVLVVEDEELVRRSLHEILTARGYRVLQARNASEAMLIGRGHEAAIDLLLTDMVLPGMSGAELAEELRPVRPEMRVLYISGYRNDPRVQRLEQTGRPFFPKPFTAAALADKVSEVLEHTTNQAGASHN